MIEFANNYNKGYNIKAQPANNNQQNVALQLAFHALWSSANLKMPIHTHFFPLAILTHKVDHTDLIAQGSLVGLCVQDYKSLCAAAMVCATLVNIQTHRQTNQLIQIARSAELTTAQDKHIQK